MTQPSNPSQSVVTARFHLFGQRQLQQKLDIIGNLDWATDDPRISLATALATFLEPHKSYELTVREITDSPHQQTPTAELILSLMMLQQEIQGLERQQRDIIDAADSPGSGQLAYDHIEYGEKETLLQEKQALADEINRRIPPRS
jgi:hypothetical protein